MPGFNAKKLAYKVRNANACAVLIGDQVIGFGQSSSPSIDFGAETLYGIGSAKPQEIQQLKFAMTIALDSMELTDEGLTFFGIDTPLQEILANNQFNIHVADDKGHPLKTFVGCVAGNVNTTLTANQPLSESISFMAMDVLNKNGDSIMNSNSAANFNSAASSLGGLAAGVAGI